MTCLQEEKKDIWLSPMKKALTPTENSKKQGDNTETQQKTSITQQFRTNLEWLVVSK